MIYSNDPGPWYIFVKRPDNVGKNIMEVKQKYLSEYNRYQAELFHVLSFIGTPGQAGTGGGPSFTPAIPSVISSYVDPDYVDPDYVQ